MLSGNRMPLILFLFGLLLVFLFNNKLKKIIPVSLICLFILFKFILSSDAVMKIKSDIDKDGTVNAKLVFMGCKDDINNDLFFSALQQYIFIQFFKKIKRNSNPGDTDYVYLFEKGVSEQLFDILNKDNKINHLRNDIDTIFRELDDLYEVIIQ